MQIQRPFERKNPLKSIRTAILYAAVVFISFGCDGLEVTPGGDSIFLSTSRVVCFEFQNLDDGGSQTIVSSDTFDLEAFLSGEGFAKSEVLGTQVTAVSARLRFPGQESLSAFSQIRVSLRAGANTTSIGSGSSFGNERSTNLSATRSDVGSIIRASSFQGVLDLTGAADIQDDCLIEVELDFDVEVEGI